MLRFVKHIVWLLGVMIGCQSAFGFQLIGPIPNNGDAYQTTVLGYNLTAWTVTGTIVSSVGGYAAPGIVGNATIFTGLSDDMGTPKNIGEGYRRNTPVMYYAFDASFMNFFGPDGAAEVDKAMAIYSSLAPVSSYSPDLSEFPQDSRRENFRAASSALLDIRSVTMGLMTEQLGFWEPVRWVWALHGRVHLTGTGIPPCPAAMEYLIDRRNLDITSSDATNFQYSSYVNGVLYSYFIDEFCNGTPTADAVEFPVDPLSSPYSAVADFTSAWYQGLQPGMFYTSLTRDDVAGLRYLIRTNNFAFETSGARVIEFITNSAPAAVTNQDLSLFAARAHTNDAAGLLALYPGLIINSTTNFFGITITTNITETLVNSPLDPAGALPNHPIFSTNYTTNFANFFVHTFANVITNTYATRGVIGVLTLSITNDPFAVAGTTAVTTNGLVSVRPLPVSGVFGDFFILPTNFCSAQVLSNLFTQLTVTTNLPTTVVGPAANSITFTPGSITFFTNHVTVYLPVACPLDAEGTYGGVEQIKFIRRDYDSIVNQPWDPVTNDYVVPELTNSTIVLRHRQRFVPKPDFLFSAADLAFGSSVTYSNTVTTTNSNGGASSTETLSLAIAGFGKYDVLRTINFNQDARPGHNAGPGTIETPAALSTLMIFNKVGPLYFNSSDILSTNSFFVEEPTQSPFQALSWGSFDGTTNAPEVYPNGHTIGELENLLTGPAITTRSLPTAGVGGNYSAQLAAQGGHPPYSWALSPNSAGLPTGLNISPNGQITGTPAGPAAIYDFTVRVTDSSGAFNDIPFTISVF